MNLHTPQADWMVHDDHGRVLPGRDRVADCATATRTVEGATPPGWDRPEQARLTARRDGSWTVELSAPHNQGRFLMDAATGTTDAARFCDDPLRFAQTMADTALAALRPHLAGVAA